MTRSERSLHAAGKAFQHFAYDNMVSAAMMIDLDYEDLFKEIDRLKSRVEELEADAKRYETVRTLLLSGVGFDVDEATADFRVIGCCPTPEQFDAAIDAAIAESAK